MNTLQKVSLAIGLLVFLLGSIQAKVNATVVWEPKSLRVFAAHTGHFYRYAPATIANGSTEQCWTCQNATEGFIKDSVYLTERHQGRIEVNQPAITAGAPGAWDSYHVCDPSVIGGRFRFAQHLYHYALFYTGNDVNASRHNQIGVAFANHRQGPWLKCPIPLVFHADDGTWGVGQPSAVRWDKAGGVLLFYTAGDGAGTRLFCRHIRLWDTSSPNAALPHFESTPDVQLTNTGLTGANGQPDYLNNVDVAYAPKQRRFYAVREQHPYPKDYPHYIGVSLQLVSIAADNVWHGGGAWRVEGEIGPTLTGLPRNHNAGLLRTLAGTLPDPHHIGVIFTGSCAGPDCKVAEWSYDLWQ
ncbi:MAG: hypothetical protein JOZ57_09365, partial [Abitibacteriaceae bacterium]|nr:hypothetical protein [Abditibacteriaceae bacterium]